MAILKPKEVKKSLLRLNKKSILIMMGYRNIKDYYKSTGEIGKVSRKQLIYLLMLQMG